MNNHETLKALYQLDVAEVGEEEAAKLWEYKSTPSDSWFQSKDFHTGKPVAPTWTNTFYRRKPGIPWPKAFNTRKGAVDCNECVNRGKYVDSTGAIMGEVTFCEMCEHFRRVNYFKRTKQE